MPDLSQIAADPDFLALDAAGKRQVMTHFDPEGFGKLDAKHQAEVLGHFTGVSVAHGAESIGLDPHLSVAQAHAESGFDETAVSPKGAQGVMQVMPDTGAEVRRRMAAGTLPTPQGVPEPVAVGLAYQHEMKQRFGDDGLALAAYNAGPGRVESALARAKAAGRAPTIEGILPFLPSETQDYVTKVLHTAHTMRAAAGAPGTPAPTGPSAPAAAPQPTEAPETTGDPATTTSPTTTQAPDRNPASLLAQHLVSGPAAEWNALAHKFGIPGATDPHEARLAGLRYGYPGAEDWPRHDPEGKLETTAAALAPAEALWPTGALAWTAAATLSNKRVADTVEAVLGIGAMARGGLKAVRYLKGRSPAELAHLAAKAILPGRTEDLRVARDGLRATVDRVEQAIQYHGQEAAKLDAAARALPSTVGEVRQALTTTGDATPEVVGKMLQATGKAAETLAGDVGVSKGMSAHLRKVTELYEGARKLADQTGAMLPPKGADHLELLDAVDSYIKHGGSASDPVVQQIRNLGLVGVRTADGSIMSMRQAGDIDAYLNAHPDAEKVFAPISYRKLSETYAELANASATPRAYATATDRSSRAFYRLVRGGLKTAMEKLEAGDPDLRNAAARADQYYRDTVVPYRRTARAVLGESVEPAKAFDRLVDQPEHLVRHLAMASVPERQALADAWLDRLIRSHSNALGEIDFGGVLKDWNTADDTVRSLVSSAGAADQVSGPARVLNEWSARAKHIEDARASLAEFKRGLTANKTRVLRQAKDDVTNAITALRDAQRRVKQTGRMPVGPVRTPEEAEVLGFGSGMRMFGRMHLVLGIKDLFTGNVAMAALQGAEAALMMRRPRLVAQAVRVPVRGEDGALLGAVLHGLVQTLGPSHAVAQKAQQAIQSPSESSPQP